MEVIRRSRWRWTTLFKADSSLRCTAAGHLQIRVLALFQHQDCDDLLDDREPGGVCGNHRSRCLLCALETGDQLLQLF